MQRGVDVMMEVDTPGHTTAIAESHPEHVACANKRPWTAYALGKLTDSQCGITTERSAEPPAGQLRIASEEVSARINVWHPTF